MSERVIKSILTNKFKDFVKTIKDETVKGLVERNTIITGGAIASLLLKEEVHDFDLYFTNKETVKAVAEYYVKEFNEAHQDNKNKLGYRTQAFVLDGEDVEAFNNGNKTIEQIAPGYTNQGDTVSHMITNTAPDRIKVIIRSDGVAGEKRKDTLQSLSEADEADYQKFDSEDAEALQKPRYRPIFLSSNAITLSQKIQLVLRFYGDADEIHENYDFAHCTNYWESGTGKLTLRKEALSALLGRELIYQGSKYPLCSMIRTRKFLKRGFHINAGQYLKMAFQISDLDLKDVAVLEEQLVGVDTCYFQIMIDAIQKSIKANDSFKLSNDYVVSLIDKIF